MVPSSLIPAKLRKRILLFVQPPVDIHEEIDRVGDQHDKPADDEPLGDDQRADGSPDRKGTDIAPEDAGRVVLKEEVRQQGAGQAEKKQCIVNVADHDGLEHQGCTGA